MRWWSSIREAEAGLGAFDCGGSGAPDLQRPKRGAAFKARFEYRCFDFGDTVEFGPYDSPGKALAQPGDLIRVIMNGRKLKPPIGSCLRRGAIERARCNGQDGDSERRKERVRGDGFRHIEGAVILVEEAVSGWIGSATCAAGRQVDCRVKRARVTF